VHTLFSRAERVRIPKDTAEALKRGHPWAYGPLSRPDPGSPVVLIGPRDEVIGWGLADAGDIAVRALGRGEPPNRTVADVLRERVQRADAARFRLVDGDTDCWRVLNAEGDGLPGLIVDRYADLAVLKVYAGCWLPHLEAVFGAVRSLGWAAHGLRRLGVRNVDGKDGGEPIFGQPPEMMVVSEHGMRLPVRPWVGQKTGLFLDQREHRLLVRRVAGGRRTANLFAYNGGFSVAAALGGASEVITVDVAPAAIEDAREAFRLNGLNPDEHIFEVADAFEWRPRGRLGLLIVDPPSLARGERSRGAAGSAYRKLHAGLGGSVEIDGLLATSSCTAQLDWTAWSGSVVEGLMRHGAWSWSHQSRAPADHPVSVGHPEGQYLKFGLLRRLDALGG
jgi:23S rRNA (cytosine1962-C5)-methyltransferase